MISLFLTNILSRALGLLAAIFMSILVVNFANATERLFPDSAQLQSGNSAPAASSSRSPLDDLLAESRRLHANNEAKAAYEYVQKMKDRLPSNHFAHQTRPYSEHLTISRRDIPPHSLTPFSPDRTDQQTL